MSQTKKTTKKTVPAKKKVAKKTPTKKVPAKKKVAKKTSAKKDPEKADSPAREKADKSWKDATAPKEPEKPAPARKMVKPGTMEATIVVCQCGKTAFEITKQTTTAVSLKCASCGHELSVKGPVAITHVKENEVLAAIKESIVRPDPTYQASTKKKAQTPEQEAEAAKYTMLRFRVLIEAKDSVIDKAMEAVRLENSSDDNYKQQTWQGHALEYICADYLSGVNPEILSHIDQIEEDIEKLIKAEKEDGTGEASLTRKVRDTRQKLREKAAAEMGIIKPAKKKPAKKTEAKRDDDERIKDQDRLLKIVKNTMIDFAETYREERKKTLGLLINVTVPEAVKRSNKDGGFVIEVRGDKRTRDKTGNTPSVVFWLEKETPTMAELELEIEYQDAYELELPTAELEIVEIVPKENVTWEMPAFCTSREEK